MCKKGDKKCSCKDNGFKKYEWKEFETENETEIVISFSTETVKVNEFFDEVDEIIDAFTTTEPKYLVKKIKD